MAKTAIGISTLVVVRYFSQVSSVFWTSLLSEYQIKHVLFLIEFKISANFRYIVDNYRKKSVIFFRYGGFGKEVAIQTIGILEIVHRISQIKNLNHEDTKATKIFLGAKAAKTQRYS